MTTSKGYFQLVTGPSGLPEQTLLLIGTAVDGPARLPFRLKESANPEEILGDTPLFQAYDMAKKAGATDIILYRLNGEYASKTLTGMVYDPIQGLSTEKPILTLKSVAASDEYNKVRMVIAENALTAYNAEGEEQRVYVLTEHPTIKDLVDAINLDAEYGIVDFQAQGHEMMFPSLALRELNTIVELSNGQTEMHLIEERDLHIDELNSRLLSVLYSGLAYDQENYIINSDLGMMDLGIVCVTCLYHDDGIKLAETIGRFCYQKSIEVGQGCLGVIGVKPIEVPTVEFITAKIDELLVMKQPELGGFGGPEQIMIDNAEGATWESHVQVVVGEAIKYKLNGTGVIRTSLAPSYAGLQASLPIQSSTTNKQINGLNYLSYEFSKEDVDKLLSNGYISIIRSVRRGFVPYAETTYMNKPRSILRNASAIRISHYVSRRLAEMLDNAVGSRTTPMSRRDTMSLATELCQSLLTPDIVKSFEIGFVHSSEAQGSMSVKLEIVPHSEVSAITSLVKLPFMQGGF